MIAKNIFREYDIRGIYEQDLTLPTVYAIARAFADLAYEHNHRRVIIGRDNRESSPAIKEEAIRGLLDSGLEVIDVGLVITPIFYYAARYLDIPAGLMITASHNGAEYNGMKVLLGDTTIYGDQIVDLWSRAERGVFRGGNGGSLEKCDITEAYIAMIKSKIKLGPRHLKTVIDCGNGTASLFAPRILKELGCDVVELYCESDPHFPHHHPDPVSIENCQDLIRMVIQEGADLGIGFDGDGDRLGIVDPHGNIIWGDLLMILFWREILPRFPNSKCIVEVKCSQSLIDEINLLGGTPIFFKTGHSLIKAKMKEIGAVFTGEMSGHMFFADEYYGYDDAIYAVGRLLRILSNTDLSIDILLGDINKYHSTPEIRILTTDEKKLDIVQQVLEFYRPKREVVDIDGARILFPDGWGLVRASNTGPYLIMRCEATSQDSLKQIFNQLSLFLRTLGIDVPYSFEK